MYAAIRNIIRATTSSNNAKLLSAVSRATGARLMMIKTPQPESSFFRRRPDTDEEDSGLEYEAPNFNSTEETILQPKRWIYCYDPLVCPSAQVLSVKLTELKIDPIDRDRIGIYGRIVAVDDLDFCRNYLYRRERSDCEYVKLEEDITLVGPSRGICGLYHPFHFQFNLNYAGREISEDKPVSKGEREVHLDDDPPPDSVFTKVIRGKYGAVEMTYAFFNEAVEATVEIHSTSNCRASLAKLVAYICSDKIPSLVQKEIVLFDGRKPTNKEITSDPNGTFQLWRSVLAVPADGGLQIEAHIGPLDSSSSKGVSKFFSTAKHNIEDRDIPLNSQMVLKVSWSSLWDP